MKFAALGLLAAATTLVIECEAVRGHSVILSPANSGNSPSSDLSRSTTEQKKTTNSNCPADVKKLTNLLLENLPGYANRVIQRTRLLQDGLYSYVLVAGRPQFKPLSLGPGIYAPVPPGEEVQPPEQVFFTTLERQYTHNEAVTIQHYYWLFLTQTESGWKMAMLFSRFGSPAPGRAPLAPRGASNGAIGQAISLWLRDCRAGEIGN